MAGAIRKTMQYLGIAEDTGQGKYDEYEEYEEYEEAPEHVDESVGAQVTPINRSRFQHEPMAAQEHDLRRITTVHPRSYNDARVIGEAFRAGTPVIMNLSDMDDADAKRLVDFSAGLIFGLRGNIERVTSKVFLLSPESVEITGEANESALQGGSPSFYNQS
ncbi:cell division protein SepF [Jonesiaceae bacterium BS-20]|uniref:Cell division protein SepF n=1 Tax=Jonesiaceae bacterium BS-20 TaxID=3120821 RepID=A0AAU7E029_9MICO